MRWGTTPMTRSCAGPTITGSSGRRQFRGASARARALPDGLDRLGRRPTGDAVSDRYLTQNQQSSTPVGWPPDRAKRVHQRAKEAVKDLAFDGVADAANS